MERDYDALNKLLCAELRGEMARVQITQEEVADNLGISRQSISRYLGEKPAKLPATTLIAWADCLNVDPFEIQRNAYKRAGIQIPAIRQTIGGMTQTLS